MIEQSAQAETLVVSATVPAPIPSDPPVFTAPADGTVVHTPEVAFAGNCPIITPAVIIALYDGATLLGSTPCAPDGTFNLSASISQGSHTITAQVVTITNQTGQTSAPLHLTYTPLKPEGPETPGNPKTPDTPGTPSLPSLPDTPIHLTDSLNLLAPLLQIDLTSPAITYRPGFRTSFEASFRGGAPPYRIIIDWGDGSRNIEIVSSSKPQTFSHIYTIDDPDLLTITVTDQESNILTRQYAVVNATPAALTAVGFSSSQGLLETIKHYLLSTPVIAYAALLALLGWLWHLEFSHYPRRIGLSTHYNWQRKKIGRKHR